MAKMSFKAENKAASDQGFPKLKLDQDESARIALFEEPEYGYVHNLRAPRIVNGEVQYKVVQTKQGPERQMEFDFVGNPICLGSKEVLEERSVDPKNCPACKAAQEEPDMFSAPKRRFAMHVFQYNTNGGTKPNKSFGGSVKVWAFTDQKFNEIIDLLEEAPDNDPANIDLILGPCENKLFQKYKMIHSSQVAWKQSDATRATFQATIEDERAKDLTTFLGRNTKKEWLEDDLDKVRNRWKTVNGRQGETAADGLAEAEPSLDAGLENLLNEDVQPKSNESPAPKASSGSTPNFDDLLSGL